MLFRIILPCVAFALIGAAATAAALSVSLELLLYPQQQRKRKLTCPFLFKVNTADDIEVKREGVVEVRAAPYSQTSKKGAKIGLFSSKF